MWRNCAFVFFDFWTIWYQSGLVCILRKISWNGASLRKSLYCPKEIGEPSFFKLEYLFISLKFLNHILISFKILFLSSHKLFSYIFLDINSSTDDVWIIFVSVIFHIYILLDSSMMKRYNWKTSKSSVLIVFCWKPKVMITKEIWKILLFLWVLNGNGNI